MALPQRPFPPRPLPLSQSTPIIGVNGLPKRNIMVQTVHLPNGQTYTVTPIFGGFTFKSNDLDIHHSAIPPGWNVTLQTVDEVEEEEEEEEEEDNWRRGSTATMRHHADYTPAKHAVVHRFTRPTLQKDCLFISSVSVPASSDFKAPTSPTRHTAMMLWATLNWYFHKEPPSPHVKTEDATFTPESGRPKAEWRIKIKREGIFKGRNTLQKLERMGLIASEDSSVGADTDIRNPDGWGSMFVSRKAFWQLDARLFLFTLAPVHNSPLPSQSPHPSRPASPERGEGGMRNSPKPNDYVTTAGSAGILPDLSAGIASPGGPFASGSHLPTYYPAPPTQFTFTNHIRHPIRQKPPRQGETFYTRYVPSVDQWLSFRVPSLSSKPVPHMGPGGPKPAGMSSAGGSISVATLPTLASFVEKISDADFMHRWMNDPRVNYAWGGAGPRERQQQFLTEAMSSKHSFPVIGCWDGKPFGYFEIYWVKEDKFGRLLGGEVGNFTRGLHVLVGEQEFRGPHRVKLWLSALVHYCFLADARTETVILEPRVDNVKFIDYLQEVGFYKQGEVSFPHKQSAVMKIDRESWEAPCL